MIKQELVSAIETERLKDYHFSDSQNISTAPNAIGCYQRNSKWVTYSTDADGVYHLIKKCPSQEAAFDTILYEMRLAKKKGSTNEKTALIEKLDELRPHIGHWIIVFNTYSAEDFIMGYYFNKETHSFAVYKNNNTGRIMKSASNEIEALKELTFMAETEKK